MKTSVQGKSPHTPIFIVGHPRSGTTLLRFILSSHPRIYVPDETGFIPFLCRRVEAELSLGQTKRILERIGRLNQAWHGLVDDVPAFYHALPEPTLSHLLDALYRQKVAEACPERSRRDGAVRWGDKTPTYVRYIPLLSRIFPSAQFVHLIRDGRDATLSAQKKWGTGRAYMDNYYLLRTWVKNVERGRAAGKALGPDRYLEVHYESLVQQPQPVVERIVAFLGEQFHPAMLDHAQLAREQIGPAGHVEVREPISTGSVQRWRKEMSPFDQKVADRVAGPTLSALGYELADRGPWSADERFRLLFLSSKYLLTDTARALLTALGVLTLNRGKRRR